MRRGVRAALVAACALGGLLAPAAQASDRTCDETLVRMSDGVRLHAWSSRPAPDRVRPVLFMMDSYARQGRPGEGPSYGNACPEVLPDDYVPAFLSEDVVGRFNLVQVSYRGTGSSEGVFDVTGERTQRDIREAIAWAARQPWSSGDVTLVGESGTAFYAHHALREPSVRAAVVYTSCADMYRCFFRGGQYNGLADVYLAATEAGYLATLGERDRLGTLANPDPARQLAALGAASAQVKADAVNGAWWRERSALDALPATRVPVMYTTDLYDIVQPFDAFRVTPGARLNLAMGHVSAGAVEAGGERHEQLVREPVDRFVARYGLGDDNGAERDPRVTLATNVGGLDGFHDGHLLVRGESDWPLPSTRWTRLHLGDGTLVRERPEDAGGADTAPLVAGAHADLRTQGFVRGRELESDLRSQESSGLTYTSTVLGDDLELSGPMALRLFASATARDFDWSVRLTDVWPDGRSEWISDGYLRASLRRVDPARSEHDAEGRVVAPWHDFDRPEPVPVGEPVEYLIAVIPTSNVFRKGHRLRLDVLPVGAAQADSARTGGAGAVTVLRDPEHPSSLIVPVIPSRCGHSAPLTAGTPAVGRCARSWPEAVRP